jgi:hypothetical protein
MANEHEPRPDAHRDEFNPYSPPASPIGEEMPELVPGDLGEAESIRRQYLSHEASVKSIGSLEILGFTFCILAAVTTIAVGLNATEPLERVGAWGGAAVYVVFGALHLALGIGLNRLQAWARWTCVALLGFGLLVGLIGLGTMAFLGGIGAGSVGLVMFLIPGYMLYLLLSRKSTRVFSREYRAIIEQTPHIRYRTSLLVKLALVLLVGVFVLGIIAAVTTTVRVK